MRSHLRGGEAERVKLELACVGSHQPSTRELPGPTIARQVMMATDLQQIMSLALSAYSGSAVRSRDVFRTPSVKMIQERRLQHGGPQDINERLQIERPERCFREK